MTQYTFITRVEKVTSLYLRIILIELYLFVNYRLYATTNNLIFNFNTEMQNTSIKVFFNIRFYLFFNKTSKTSFNESLKFTPGTYLQPSLHI